MNNKQKEIYLKEAITLKIDAIRSALKKDWPEEYQSHFESFPKKLYKYVRINNKYIDSIRRKYIYLCPASKLDDQFECRADFCEEKILDNRNLIDDVFINNLVDIIDEYPNSTSKNSMIEFTKKCLNDDKLDLGKVSIEMKNENPDLTEEEKEELLKCFSALMSGAWLSPDTKENLKMLIKTACETKNNTGIGSLTENNKSQVMWELYGNHYKGMCIEYELSEDYDSMINTFPVIYGDKRKTNLLSILVGILLEHLIDVLSKHQLESYDSAKDYIKLFITKYDEWEFQKEWRIVGSAKLKFPVPQVKRIYLGKKVPQKREQAIIDLAREFHIELFKQQDNYESLEIEYKKMEI